MSFRLWLKGLVVFVLSSFVTTLAAVNLDPQNFNFSRAGLLRLSAMAAVIGIKAVLLYLKQSPLQVDTTGKLRLGGAANALLLCALATLTLGASGCSDTWERDTYAALAAGKSVIDCAVAGYNHFDADIRRACAADPADPGFDSAQFYITQSRETQQAIEKARQAQIAAVNAFEIYAVARIARDPAASVADKRAAVVAAVAQLPDLLSAIRALLPHPPQAAPAPHSPLTQLRPADLEPGNFGLRLAPSHAALRPATQEVSRAK